MSAYVQNAIHDADEVISGFRASMPRINDVIEAATILAIAAFLTASLNAFF